jgi:hypothetical protein
VPQFDCRSAGNRQAIREGGASINTVASLFQLSWNDAAVIARCIETGEQPRRAPDQRRQRQYRRVADEPRKQPKYRRFAAEVVRLRHEEKLPFSKIGERIWKGTGERLSAGTLQRAYGMGCPEPLRQAAREGGAPNRGRARRIGEDKFQEIRRLLRRQVKVREIARRVGVSDRTVYAEKRKLARQQKSG